MSVPSLVIRSDHAIGRIHSDVVRILSILVQALYDSQPRRERLFRTALYRGSALTSSAGSVSIYLGDLMPNGPVSVCANKRPHTVGDEEMEREEICFDRLPGAARWWFHQTVDRTDRQPRKQEIFLGQRGAEERASAFFSDVFPVQRVTDRAVQGAIDLIRFGMSSNWTLHEEH